MLLGKHGDFCEKAQYLWVRLHPDCFLTALVTAVIPFLSYTLGLERMEASKAGIIATIEPLVATLIGIVVFEEPLRFMSGAGIVLILAAVVVLNVKGKTEKQAAEVKERKRYEESD